MFQFDDVIMIVRMCALFYSENTYMYENVQAAINGWVVVLIQNPLLGLEAVKLIS